MHIDYRKKQYFKDYFKYKIYLFLYKNFGKLHTPMQEVFLQLKIRNLLPDKINALEMFGMHGLWHTMDYIKDVDSLDFFELDAVYLECAKRNVPANKTNFFCRDSIVYIKNTSKQYSLIVSDSPYGGDFYKDDGLPLFLNDIIQHAARRAIVIFNIKNEYMVNFCQLKEKITRIRRAADIFSIARNEKMSYVVVIYDEDEK